ncbi:hypothetical protein WAI453_002167 [Rhynchosporium graminicola]
MRRTYHFMGYALAARSALLAFSEDMEYARDGASPKDGSTVLQHAPEELQVEQEIYAAEDRRRALEFQPMLGVALRNIDHVNPFDFYC